MMPPKPEPTSIRLARVVLALRGRAPNELNDLLAVLNEIREEADDRCVEAPNESLQKSQGAAQHMRILLRTMMNAPALVAKSDQSKKATP